MKFRLVSLLVLAALVGGSSSADAGCGLFRRGGCSDPCGTSYPGGGAAYGSSAGAACGACGASSGAAQYSYAPVSMSGYSSAPASAGGCTSCAGSQSYGTMHSGAMSYNSSFGQTAICASPAMSAVSGSIVVPTQQQELLDCGPVTSYRVVMEPQYKTEPQVVYATEYQEEVRTRTRTISRQVPVEFQDYRTTALMVPKTETKAIEYSVLVPQTGEKTVEIVETVPVWNEVSEEYTVRVPNVIEVPEEYTVRVPTLRTEEFIYTVYVPQTQTQTKMHTFTNAVPVTKTRTIQVARPVTRTQTVTRDYGHWEVRVEEVAAPVQNSFAPVSYGVGTSGASCGSSVINMGGCGSTATYGNIGGSCGSCGGCGQVYASQGNGCRVASKCGSCGGCGLFRGHRGGGCGSASCGSSSCGGTGACGTGSVVGGYAAEGCGGNWMSGYAVAGTPACSMGAAPSQTYGTSLQTVSRRIWVPNVVTEEVPVVENIMETQEVSYTAFEQKTEQVPYECTYVVYAPEQRSGTKQVVDYATETRTRNRRVVQYNDETRTRTRKELSYKQETRTETVPVVSYTTETRTKEVSYTVNVPETKVEPITSTRFDTVQEEVTEDYTVRVPVSVAKETQVQVCRMVPKLVPVTVYPCSSAGSALMNGGTSGCTSCGTQVPTLAPAPMNGCSNCSTGACTSCQ